jgi:hypothetical protein
VISIQDGNYRSGGVTITTTGDCPYSAPTSTVTMITGNNPPTTLTPAFDPSYRYYSAGSSRDVTLTGASNRPNATISAQYSVCNEWQTYSSTINGAATGAFPTNLYAGEADIRNRTWFAMGNVCVHVITLPGDDQADKPVVARLQPKFLDNRHEYSPVGHH